MSGGRRGKRSRRGVEKETVSERMHAQSKEDTSDDGCAKKGKTSCEHIVPPHPPWEKGAKLRCSVCSRRATWQCMHCATPLCSKSVNGSGEDHTSAHVKERGGHSLYRSVKTADIVCMACDDIVADPATAHEEKDCERMEESGYMSPSGSSCSTSQLLPQSPSSSSSAPVNKQNTRGDAVECYALESRPIVTRYEDEDDDIRPKGLCGLYNLGNTCYANAAMQALSNCPPFSDFFRRRKNLRAYTCKGSVPLVSNAFSQLIHNMWSASRSAAIHPGHVLFQIRTKCPQFSGFAQQDSQEFIRCLLELIHRELARPVFAYEENMGQRKHRKSVSRGDRGRGGGSEEGREGGNCTGDSGCSSDGEGARMEDVMDMRRVGLKSVVSDVFDGTMESAVRCLTCNNVSTVTETFEDLSLQIATPPNSVIPSPVRTEATRMDDEEFPEDTWSGWMWSWMSSLSSLWSSRTVSVEDCFAAFFTPDRLSGDDMYSCDKCNKLRNGLKTYRMTRLPEILCVHLKRFHHDHITTSKISTRVSFPLVGLDVSKWASDSVGECEYDLCALVCHEGSSVDSGHYVALAKNEIDGNWYEFDDCTVTKLDDAYVLTRDAYVLFYQKRQSDGVHETREDIRQLMSPLHVTKSSRKRMYVSSEWLEKLSTFTQPGPISNYDFLCPHSNILPSRSEHIGQLCTGVNEPLWQYLVQKFGGGPPVSQLHYCAVCEEHARKLTEKRTTEVDELRAVEAECRRLSSQSPLLTFSAHLPLICMSRSWFGLWEKFISDPAAEPPGPMDNSHLLMKGANGQTMLRPRCNALIVPREVYLYFHRRYGGGPEVVSGEGVQPSETEWAELVRAAELAIAAARQKLQAEKEEEREREREQ